MNLLKVVDVYIERLLVAEVFGICYDREPKERTSKGGWFLCRRDHLWKPIALVFFAI